MLALPYYINEKLSNTLNSYGKGFSIASSVRNVDDRPHKL